MKYRMFGRTGVKVSELCLGTMTFGREADSRTSFSIMDRFAQEGGNFLDTANVYNAGESEKVLGEWLKGKDGDDFFIATKVRFPMGESPNAAGLTRKHMLKSVEDSLSRLGTDHIDLLQVHAWDPLTPIGETMRVLNNLVERGLVRYIGASNFRAWQLAAADSASSEGGLEKFASLQPQYNLLTRATEFELLPYCSREEKAVLPWSPLKGGFLSGKYTRENAESVTGTRMEERVKRGWSAPWADNPDYVWGVLDAVMNVSASTSRTPSQVALNWLLRNSAVTSPIIGARNLEQLEDNLGSTGWSLSHDEMDQLNGASRMYVTYPYDDGAEKQQMAGRVA